MGNKASGNGANPPPSEAENSEDFLVEENEVPSQNNHSGGNANNAAPNRSPSYYTLIKNSYQALVNAIIRPPRSTYEPDQLGPPKFKFCGKTIQRTDFVLTNPRNLKFVCSFWEPVEKDRPSPILPCVIYMHGNSSSRLEALSALSVVLTLGATLLAFDFCGSGLSEGDYVSLGAFEKEDLQAAIEHLRNTGRTSTIALWGRSMGAATALMYGERDPSIAGMVLDSSFADLVMLAEEMVEKGRQQGLFAPSILVKIAIKFVRSSVQKAANFDIKLISPIEHADKCFIPALFVAAEDDNFVMPSHSQKIFDKYGGDKNIMIVEGDHNTPRPRYLFDGVSIFLQSILQVPDEWVLQEGHEFTRRLPWTYRPSNGYNPTMYGKLSVDELLALQLMEEVGPNIDIESEDAMQTGVTNRLYDFFGGTSEGTTASSKGNDSTAKRPSAEGTSSKSSKQKSKVPETPKGAALIEHPETDEKCPSEMTTVARKYSKTTTDLTDDLQTSEKQKKSSSITAAAPTVAVPPPNVSVSSALATWTCATCTLINSIQHDICEACGLWKS